MDKIRGAWFVIIDNGLTAPSLPMPVRHGGGVYTTPKFS